LCVDTQVTYTLTLQITDKYININKKEVSELNKISNVPATASEKNCTNASLIVAVIPQYVSIMLMANCFETD